MLPVPSVFGIRKHRPSLRASVVPALRTEREGRGTPFTANASELKSLGHPPCGAKCKAGLAPEATTPLKPKPGLSGPPAHPLQLYPALRAGLLSAAPPGLSGRGGWPHALGCRRRHHRCGCPASCVFCEGGNPERVQRAFLRGHQLTPRGRETKSRSSQHSLVPLRLGRENRNNSCSVATAPGPE